MHTRVCAHKHPLSQVLPALPPWPPHMERLHSTVDVEGQTQRTRVPLLYLQRDTDRGNSQKEEQ